MKQILLILAILALPLCSGAETETYSCRDNEGRLHIADNLMSLPEECRYQAETLDPKDSGKVNYIPSTPQSRQRNPDFDRAVSQEQQEITRRVKEAESLVAQAKVLADAYENAVIKRKSALRSKKYGFREEIIAADQEMQMARRGKNILLEEMAQARLTATQREQVEILMDKISN